MANGLRMDHYLFRARIFKSRTKATNACKENKVLLEDKPAQAATEVHENDLIRIRDKGLYKHYRVLQLPDKNMSKEDAKSTWADETPREVKDQLYQLALAQRIPRPYSNSGKPTKKERRQIEKLKGR
ncbi:hypothetical protein K8I28_13165 [bacterium]|nr:hypothetical protein [bacterium]